MKQYVVVSVDLVDGEHMPLLCEKDSGLGLFEPTAYALTLRARGRAVNTISHALRAVRLLYQILSANNVDLIARIKSNNLLTLAEVEVLVEQCLLTKSGLEELHCGPGENQPVSLAVARFRKGSRKHAALPLVHRNTAVGRLKYVTSFLRWLVEYAYLQQIPSDRELFKVVADRVVGAISMRTPTTRKNSSAHLKRGLTKSEEEMLQELVDPEGPNNPWPEEFVRVRNSLLVSLLRATGCRKGELLGVKVGDLNLSRSTLSLFKRPDDPDEKRRPAPAAKTRERTLELGAELLTLCRRYLALRAAIPTARKHPYLIVGERGAPLSLSGVDYVFATLRKHQPEIKKLAPQLLRHTWNDRFSELVHGKVSLEEEKKTRNYLMGWSENSNTAENYTRRYREEEANKAMTKLQEKMFQPTK